MSRMYDAALMFADQIVFISYLSEMFFSSLDPPLLSTTRSGSVLLFFFVLAPHLIPINFGEAYFII